MVNGIVSLISLSVFLSWHLARSILVASQLVSVYSFLLIHLLCISEQYQSALTVIILSLYMYVPNIELNIDLLIHQIISTLRQLASLTQ